LSFSDQLQRNKQRQAHTHQPATINPSAPRSLYHQM